MKFFPLIKYPFLIVILLLSMFYLSSSFALIPVIQKLLFIVVPIICVAAGILGMRIIYKACPLPLKLKHWIAMISFSIIMGTLILFGFYISSISSKTEGLFTSYENTFRFKNITFYTYETGLFGPITHVRYSEKGEWVSHSIDKIPFRCYADSVRIEKKDTSFLIFAENQKFIFLPKSKKLVTVPD